MNMTDVTHGLSDHPELARAAERLRRGIGVRQALEQTGVLLWSTRFTSNTWQNDRVEMLEGGIADSIPDGAGCIGGPVVRLIGNDSGYAQARTAILAKQAEVAFMEAPSGLAHAKGMWLSRYTAFLDGGGRVVGLVCVSSPFEGAKWATPKVSCPFIGVSCSRVQ